MSAASGTTTGAVAVQLGRLFVGIDNDENAINISAERLSKCQSQQEH